MKKVAMVLFCFLFSCSLFAQNRKSLYKNWIKVEAQDLTGSLQPVKYLYARYSFDKNEVHISLNPAWDNASMKYDLIGQQIILGFQSYNIEELTDSTLTISAADFQRIKLKSEELLCRDSNVLRPIAVFENKPLYRATDTLSPRYKKGKNLELELGQNSHGYNIVKATTFRMEFTITEKGEVKNIVVAQGITYGFDQGMVEGLSKTSGDWKPAYFNGKPVQTRMIFERKFLNSTGLRKN